MSVISVSPGPQQPYSDQNVQMVMSPGDVLFVRGDGQFTEMGTTGGWMGHVMVVRGAPELVSREWLDEWGVKVAWPGNSVTHIWKVPTIESTRSAVGLHQCEMLVHLQPTGTLVLLGELANRSDGALEFSQIDDEIVEVWQSPIELRSQIHMDCVCKVLDDMVSCEASWSLTTVARAVFRSAKLSRRRDLLDKVQGYWDSPPICTSVVITFWQRYLCRFAQATSQRETDLILKWMPLKADRVLPGELITTLQQCGWARVARIAETQPQQFPVSGYQACAFSTLARRHSFDSDNLLNQHGCRRAAAFIMACN